MYRKYKRILPGNPMRQEISFFDFVESRTGMHLLPEEAVAEG